MNDNLPDEKEYKKYNYKLTPFKLCVLENFPFIEADFDAITNYQLLCKVVEYLNHVIDNQNTVEDNFKIMTDNLNTLYNYIDTLDLQEEINNKLDSMVEDGTIQNLLMNYASIQKVYNTHQEMMEDENLIENMKIKTLGYYSINDGGGAEYLITNTSSDKYHYEELNNGKYAELIIDDNLNIKQFGAYGDGNADDTEYFKNAINYSKSLNNKALSIAIPSGNYKISDTIDLPLYVKLYTTGNVMINYVGDNELFHIYNDVNIEQMVNNYNLGQNPFNIGNVLDGSKGVLILKGNINKNQIALKIGENSLGITHITHTAWANFSNLYIETFKQGIYFTNYQNYIMRFYNITISGCEKAILNNNIIGANNGELIEFLNCSLNNNDLALQINHIMNFSFNNSSIDYNKSGIELNWQGYYTLNLINCWLEGNNYDDNNYLIKSNVPSLSSSYNPPTVNINNCRIYPKNKKPSLLIKGNMYLNIDNTQIQVNNFNTITDKNSEFLCDKNVIINNINGLSFTENYQLISENINLNENWNFENDETGYTFSQYGVSHSIVNDLFYSNSKLLKLNNDSAKYQDITLNKFNVSKFKKIYGTALIAIISESNSQQINFVTKLKFFNKNDDEIKEVSINSDYTYTTLNQLTLVPKGITNNLFSFIDIPNEAYTCQVKITVGNITVPIYIDNISISGI